MDISKFTNNNYNVVFLWSSLARELRQKGVLIIDQKGRDDDDCIVGYLSNDGKWYDSRTYLYDLDESKTIGYMKNILLYWCDYFGMDKNKFTIQVKKMETAYF
jgi:hypothetical protein